jgi:hypothetical protein
MVSKSPQEPTYWLTQHTIDQMNVRRISEQAVTSALIYGRAAWTRGARIFAIGNREIERFRGQGIDLEDLDGVQVVTKPDGTILTVYRNRNLRDLRRHNHPRRWCRARA